MLLQHAKNRRGSTLLMVIIVFALLLVFGMAALTLSANASRNAVTDYQTQQAYFTARSAVLAAVDYVKTAPDPKALLDSLDGKTSDKTIDPQMGEYTLTVNKLDETCYQIASLAELDGVERAFYTVIEVVASASSPFENLANITGEGALSDFNNMNKSSGDIYIRKRSDGRATTIQYLNVYGDLIVDGDVAFTGGGGQISVYGDIYINGNATFNGVQINKITGSLYVWGNASFSNLTGGSTNPGTLTGNNYVNGRSTGTPIGNKPVQRIPSSMVFPEGHTDSLPSKTDPIFKPPSGVVIPSTKPQISGNNITGNGTVSTDIDDRAYVIDTSKQDIYLRFSKGDYNFNNDFTVRGSNHAYIYLDEGVTLTIEKWFGDVDCVTDYDSFFSAFDNRYIHHAPRMTIISSENVKLNVRTSSYRVGAYVYMPYAEASFEADKYYCGSLFIGRLTTRGNGKFAYIPPDEESTPPGGGGGAGSGGITVVGNYSGQSKLVAP